MCNETTLAPRYSVRRCAVCATQAVTMCAYPAHIRAATTETTPHRHALEGRISIVRSYRPTLPRTDNRPTCPSPHTQHDPCTAPLLAKLGGVAGQHACASGVALCDKLLIRRAQWLGRCGFAGLIRTRPRPLGPGGGCGGAAGGRADRARDQGLVAPHVGQRVRRQLRTPLARRRQGSWVDRGGGAWGKGGGGGASKNGWKAGAGPGARARLPSRPSRPPSAAPRARPRRA